MATKVRRKSPEDDDSASRSPSASRKTTSPTTTTSDPPASRVRRRDGNVLEVDFVRPPLYAAQQRAIFDAPDVNGRPARFALIEASTKAGKTHGCIAWLLEQAFTTGAPGKHFWWVAPIYKQTEIAFSRVLRALPRWTYRANKGNLTVVLVNGAVLQFRSGEKPDNLFGEDVYAVVIDEASRLREESWHAVRSTITATRGMARMIGNVKGRKNWFYGLARRAEKGERGLHYSKLTAYDAVKGGVLDIEEIEAAQRDLPENVFRELYLAEPSDDGGNPFGIKHIAACIAPFSEKRAEAMGLDLARTHDWCVLIGLDREGVTCGFERWQSSWEETDKRVRKFTQGTPLLVDATGVGDPVYERIALWHADAEPYVFSAKSKQLLMEGLAWAIQNQIVRFPDGAIRAELETFEYVYTRTGTRYSAPEGYHDDCVVALALAVEKYRRVMPQIGAVGPGGDSRISPWLSDDDVTDPDESGDEYGDE